MRFAAQAQGFMKVTRLRRSYIGIRSFSGVFEMKFAWKAPFVWQVSIVKIIPNAGKSYNSGCFKESDEKHFSWQAQHIVDLKVEKGDFAAQAQGFVKVTRLRRSYIGIVSFRVEF